MEKFKKVPTKEYKQKMLEKGFIWCRKCQEFKDNWYARDKGICKKCHINYTVNYKREKTKNVQREAENNPKFCDHCRSKLKTTNTRPKTEPFNHIIRHKICPNCKERVTTYEIKLDIDPIGHLLQLLVDEEEWNNEN